MFRGSVVNLRDRLGLGVGIGVNGTVGRGESPRWVEVRDDREEGRYDERRCIGDERR